MFIEDSVNQLMKSPTLCACDRELFPLLAACIGFMLRGLVAGSGSFQSCLFYLQKTHPGVHPFTCSICGHHCTTNTLLKKHMKCEHSMTTRKQQSPSSSRVEVHSSQANKNGGKPRSMLSSSSETIYAAPTTSVNHNQPVFP